MAQYNWMTCPNPVRKQLQAFCQQMRRLLRDELVAIYLHGSLAMGSLNACRVHAYLNEQLILSKDEGGVYGLKTLPSEFHSSINQALEIYRGERPDTPFDESVLAGFAVYMDECLHSF